MIIQNKIQNIIKKNGYISVDQFMEIALLDKNNGYYINKNPIGKNQDFITAPEISQIFGEIIAFYIANFIIENLSESKNINLVELGAGKGTLLNDILNILVKFNDIYQKISIKIIDVNIKLVEIQKKVLNNHIDKLEYINKLSDLSKSPLIIINNEFFDALPIKQYVRDGDLFKERVIKINSEGKFTFKNKPINNNNLPKHLKEDSKHYENHSIVEYSKLSEEYFRNIAKLVSHNKGLAINIDYGYTDFISGDSLQSIYKHQFNNIFENIGEADLTSHVNFRLLYNIALQEGIDDLYVETQKKFLVNNGIKERCDILAKDLKEQEKKDLFSRVDRLISSKQMGDLFKVLILAKK